MSEAETSTDENVEQGSEIARKLSIKVLSGGPQVWREKLVETKKPIVLCAIYGFANGYKAGATDLGEYIKFHGQFEGVNMQTGEVIRAPIAILPTFLAQAMASSLDAEAPVIDNVKQPNIVQFALEIHAVYDSKAAQLFTYKVLDRLPVKTNDPLRALRQEVRALLAAPSNVAALPNGGKGKGK